MKKDGSVGVPMLRNLDHITDENDNATSAAIGLLLLYGCLFMKKCIRCGNVFESANWQCDKCHYAPNAHHGIRSFVDKRRARLGFDPENFEILYHYENTHFWFKNRNRLIIGLLQKYFSRVRNFFEIGCGTCFVLSGISKRQKNLAIAGGDLYLEALEFAKLRLPECRLYQMDAMQIAFDDEFDVIGSFDVLEHIHNDRKALQQIAIALRKKGGLILTVPQHPFLWSDFDEGSHHVRRYKKAELIERVKEAGLTPVFVSSFMALLLPLMVLSRLSFKKKRTKKTWDGLRLPKIVNLIFECVLLMEFFLIKAGITIPFGGSLILVAIKD
jgi:SAM-dependent methyltransferase